MNYRIRNVKITDIEDLVKINELSLPAVNSISKSKFEWFYSNSIYFKLIQTTNNNEVHGFLLALNSLLNYESLNYKWFQERFNLFAYIDRIAILDKYKRNGLGKKLYADLEKSIKSKYNMIMCEYNLKPMNYESEKFHISVGYKRVGKLITHEGIKEVSLMIKKI